MWEILDAFLKPDILPYFLSSISGYVILRALSPTFRELYAFERYLAGICIGVWLHVILLSVLSILPIITLLLNSQLANLIAAALNCLVAAWLLIQRVVGNYDITTLRRAFVKLISIAFILTLVLAIVATIEASAVAFLYPAYIKETLFSGVGAYFLQAVVVLIFVFVSHYFFTGFFCDRQTLLHFYMVDKLMAQDVGKRRGISKSISRCVLRFRSQWLRSKCPTILIIIVLFVSLAIISIDLSQSVLTPKVEVYKEHLFESSPYGFSNAIVLLRYYNGSYRFRRMFETDYLIKRPLLSGICVVSVCSVVLPNPSDCVVLGEDDPTMSRLDNWEKIWFVDSDNGYQDCGIRYSFVPSKSNIQKVAIDFHNCTVNTVRIRAVYSKDVNVSDISVVDWKKESRLQTVYDFGNGTRRNSFTILISNNENATLLIPRLEISEVFVNRVGNEVQFYVNENLYSVFTSQDVFTPWISVSPNTEMNVTVSYLSLSP